MRGGVVTNEVKKEEKQETPKIVPRIEREEDQEEKRLRSEWTKMFLKHKGFQYILNVFMEKNIKTD